MVYIDVSGGRIERSNEREEKEKKHIVSNGKMKSESVFHIYNVSR